LLINRRIGAGRDRGVDVIRLPTHASGTQRARWLAELAQVLDEAQALVSGLAEIQGPRVETLDLSARLEAARAEVQSLRRSRTRPTPSHTSVDWSSEAPWHRAFT
jgi:hypothetical protein